MKLSIFAAAIAAGAALVSAAPLSIIVVSKTSVERPVDFPGAVRFGHAVPEMPRKALGWRPDVGPTDFNRPQVQRKRPCMGGMLRQKAVNVSNSFREMFGLPLIEVHHKNTQGERFKILPFMPAPAAPHIVEHTMELKPMNQADWQRSHPRPHFHHNHHMHQEQDFFVRIQNAIMSLGPWEGRAVAFVLGCGIGVLLRMFFVLSVVLYRSIRGSNDEHEYEEVLVFEVEESDARRAPPAYVYPVDEKVAVEAPAQAPSA